MPDMSVKRPREVEPPFRVLADRYMGWIRLNCGPLEHSLYNESLHFLRLEFDNWPECSLKIQDSFVDMNIIRDQLTSCDSMHVECASKQGHSLFGLRVIDCDLTTVVEAPSPCFFVALSYVWGTAANLYDFTTQPLVVDPPQTIVDSMKVTKMLGFRYLWVDRYVGVFEMTCVRLN